jgi:restriction system-associated AAA family ATPase
VENSYKVHITELLDGTNQNNDLISKLKRCSTSWFEDSLTDLLYIDYCVNQATKDAFKNNFNSAVELFQALQVLLTLNLYSVSDKLKAELYQSNSLYVSETVPSLPSDERIMRIKHFWISKTDIKEPVLLKSLSDGEHQLLHTLGLCSLFKDTNSLFLLDEPETHFNPQWRANFISRLRQSFSDKDRESHNQEMLITTHTPFLISDSTPDKVLVFNKDKETGEVAVSTPEYNTLGASINKITMATFDKRETIGGLAQSLLNEFKASSEQQETDKNQLIKDINNKLGDSVEKVLLIKTILDSMEGGD